MDRPVVHVGASFRSRHFEIGTVLWVLSSSLRGGVRSIRRRLALRRAARLISSTSSPSYTLRDRSSCMVAAAGTAQDASR